MRKIRSKTDHVRVSFLNQSDLAVKSLVIQR